MIVMMMMMMMLMISLLGDCIMSHLSFLLITSPYHASIQSHYFYLKADKIRAVVNKHMHSLREEPLMDNILVSAHDDDDDDDDDDSEDDDGDDDDDSEDNDDDDDDDDSDDEDEDDNDEGGDDDEDEDDKDDDDEDDDAVDDNDITIDLQLRTEDPATAWIQHRSCGQSPEVGW